MTSLNYVISDVEVHDALRLVWLPITFRYYPSDFGRIQDVRIFLLKYCARGGQRAALVATFKADDPVD